MSYVNFASRLSHIQAFSSFTIKHHLMCKFLLLNYFIKEHTHYTHSHLDISHSLSMQHFSHLFTRLSTAAPSNHLIVFCLKVEIGRYLLCALLCAERNEDEQEENEENCVREMFDLAFRQVLQHKKFMDNLRYSSSSIY